MVLKVKLRKNLNVKIMVSFNVKVDLNFRVEKSNIFELGANGPRDNQFYKKD